MIVAVNARRMQEAARTREDLRVAPGHQDQHHMRNSISGCCFSEFALADQVIRAIQPKAIEPSEMANRRRRRDIEEPRVDPGTESAPM